MRFALSGLAVLCVASVARAAQARGTTNSDHDWITFELAGRRIASTFQDLDGDGRQDLVIVTIDDREPSPQRWLQIHRAEADRSLPKDPSQRLAVPAIAATLIFGNHTADAGIEIGFLAPDGVYVYPKQGATLLEPATKLIHTRTFFRAPSASSLPIWSWGTDLDGDGLYDLLVPTPDGYTVYLQSEAGRYGRVTRLESGVPADQALERVLVTDATAEHKSLESYALTVRRTLPRLFEADIDSNGTRDLVAFHGEWIRTFFQNPGGAFAAASGVAERVPTLLTRPGNDLDKATSAQFLDIDGDGNVDLIVTKVRGTLDDLKSFITIHFGSGYGIYREDYVFELGGISTSPGFVDFNGDGCADVVTHVTRADTLGKMLSSFWGDVEVSYKIYQFLPGERRFDRMSYQETIAVNKSAFDRGGLGQVSRLEFSTDWTGNGLIDKIRIDPDGRMRVYEGALSPEKRITFGQTPVYTRTLPRQPPSVYYADFNGDRKTDAMMLEPRGLGLLLSK